MENGTHGDKMEPEEVNWNTCQQREPCLTLLASKSGNVGNLKKKLMPFTSCCTRAWSRTQKIKRKRAGGSWSCYGPAAVPCQGGEQAGEDKVHEL